jgi:hypothetical protein
MKAEAVMNAYEAFQKEIPEIRKVLESEFRKLLGGEPSILEGIPLA